MRRFRRTSAPRTWPTGFARRSRATTSRHPPARPVPSSSLRATPPNASPPSPERMARVAFAWELGLSYGHAIGCAGLARPLSLHGHPIAFMFRELRQLAVIPESSGYDVFQAPCELHAGENAGMPASYADVLLGCGYRDPARLVGLLGGWRKLLELWRPDLVVADFAPTALLAAHS